MRIEKPNWAIGLTVLCAFVLTFGYGLQASAQEDVTTEDELIAEAIERSFEEEITVTGSLIPRADLTALSPVTVLNVEEEMSYIGLSRIEDLVISLPSVFAGQNSTIANGASGTATIDLRYLGTSRTLVLVNGRRMAGGDAWQGGLSYAPDINAIPGALVKRVDVLTGGASTVYGSDAVAGVVNFVIDTDFEGFRGGVQGSFYQHDNSNDDRSSASTRKQASPTRQAASCDGDAFNAYFAVGGKFADGKGHAMGYITYRQIEAITKSAATMSIAASAPYDDGPGCSGSSTSAEGRFIAYNADGSLQRRLPPAHGRGRRRRPLLPAAYRRRLQLRPVQPPAAPRREDHRRWLRQLQGQRPLRALPRSDGHDQLDRRADRPDGQLQRVQLHQLRQPAALRPTARTICGEGTGYGPTDLADVIICRRNVEGGARSNGLGHDNLRLVAGVRGDINDTWAYDVYLLHAQNNSLDQYNNDFNIRRMSYALDVIAGPDGEPMCREDSENGCVPWNIFQEGGVTQEALDYMYADYVHAGRVETQVANLTFTGDLEDYGIEFPSATEGIGVAARWRVPVRVPRQLSG